MTMTPGRGINQNLISRAQVCSDHWPVHVYAERDIEDLVMEMCGQFQKRLLSWPLLFCCFAKYVVYNKLLSELHFSTQQNH